MSRLKRRLHQTLQRFGFDVVPYDGRYFHRKKRIEIMRHGEVGIVVDVGANEGQFAQDIRGDGWRGRIVSVEPLPNAYAALATKATRDPLWTTVNVAAGAGKAAATLNVARNSVSSGLLKMSDRHTTAAPQSGYVDSVEVVVDTIDSLVAELQLTERLYLKIDTQGYELEVLRGASSVLEQCSAIELELSLSELYDQQPLMPDVVRWLLDRGFVAITLWPSFVTAEGDLLQMDGIFVRPPA